MLVAFVVAVALVCAVPGPDIAYVVAHSVADGRRTGVVASLGMSVGMLAHTSAAALGLSAAVAAHAGVLEAIRWIGAAFLVWLAVSAFRSGRSFEPGRQVAPHGTTRVFAMAAATNLANPKIIVFFLAFLPQFVTTDGWPLTAQLLVLGTAFTLVGLLNDLVYAVLAAALRGRVLENAAAGRWMHRLAGTVYAALAIRLVVSSPARA